MKKTKTHSNLKRVCFHFNNHYGCKGQCILTHSCFVCDSKEIVPKKVYLSDATQGCLEVNMDFQAKTVIMIKFVTTRTFPMVGGVSAK